MNCCEYLEEQFHMYTLKVSFSLIENNTVEALVQTSRLTSLPPVLQKRLCSPAMNFNERQEGSQAADKGLEHSIPSQLQRQPHSNG